MNYITFDIETYHPDRAKVDELDMNKIRVSVTGAYISWIDEYIAFLEQDTKDFLNALKQADVVVGYNHVWFDLPVLQKYADWDLKQVNNYDIMLEFEKKVGYKSKLNDLVKANFGEQKTDHYETFKHYYYEDNWFPLIDYNMNDVRLTEKLFRKILRGENLKYADLHEVKEVLLNQPQLSQKTMDHSGDMESIF